MVTLRSSIIHFNSHVPTDMGAQRTHRHTHTHNCTQNNITSINIYYMNRGEEERKKMHASSTEYIQVWVYIRAYTWYVCQTYSLMQSMYLYTHVFGAWLRHNVSTVCTPAHWFTVEMIGRLMDSMSRIICSHASTASSFFFSSISFLWLWLWLWHVEGGEDVRCFITQNTLTQLWFFLIVPSTHPHI